MYGTNTLRARKDASQFHAAGTLNIGGGLSLEIGVVENKIAAKGVRPVLTCAAGPLTARLGFEAGKYAAVGYDFGGFKLTGNVANGKRDAATRNNQSAFALTAAVGEDKVRTVYAGPLQLHWQDRRRRGNQGKLLPPAPELRVLSALNRPN